MKFTSLVLLVPYILRTTNGLHKEGPEEQTMLDMLAKVFPWLEPNNYATKSPHAIDRGHFVAHDFRYTFEDLADEYGYQHEEHKVTTDDGYIITMYRIKKQTTPANAPVVFLMHGIMDTADCWVMAHHDEAPAFVLADEGYDVWLGNQRGNKFSRTHKYLDPDLDPKQYFDFSWQKMGDHDAPAFIQYVIKNTGRKNITWIGHSQGSTQMFYALASKNRDFFKDKVNLFVALAPVTKLEHSKSKLINFVDGFYNQIDWVIKNFKMYDVFSGYGWTLTFKITCGTIPSMCTWIEGLLITQNPGLDDPDRFQVYMGHIPGGGSTKSYMHYAQSISSGKFALFDYGATENPNHYGQRSPPEVDLSQIEIPVAMFAGKEDDLGDIKDTEWARDQIGKAVVHYQEIEGGHASFMVGEDMSYLEDLVRVLEKYNPVKLASEQEEINEIEETVDHYTNWENEE